MIKICLYILAIVFTYYTHFTCYNSVKLDSGLGLNFCVPRRKNLFNFCLKASNLIFLFLVFESFWFKWWLPFLVLFLPEIVINIVFNNLYVKNTEATEVLAVWGTHTIISFALSIIFTLSFICAKFF